MSSFRRRLAAWLIDGVILSVVFAIIGLVFPPDRFAAVGKPLIGWLYFALFTGLEGQTPGKMLVGIKVVDAEGRVPGRGSVLMREVIGKFVSIIPLTLGYLWMLWDPKSQTWHDKMAGTYVIRV